MVSFIGEGGTSLGEWHEAINLCAARRLPAIFCVQNNQTALSTAVPDQSAVRVFADKAAGYGIPGLTLDGTDPDSIAAAFAWAGERARAGRGPTLIELVAMRMCGHAHHDDMLYLGRSRSRRGTYPELTPQGYADRSKPTSSGPPGSDCPLRGATRGRGRDRSGAAGAVDARGGRDRRKREARQIIDAPWPDARSAGADVYADQEPLAHVEALEGRSSRSDRPATRDATGRSTAGRPSTPGVGRFWKRSCSACGDALRGDDRVFIYGQDTGRRLRQRVPAAAPAARGVRRSHPQLDAGRGRRARRLRGSALAGQRPIGEIQFNDFVATGFNQLVNNAAKIRYRWGGSVPMVVRMPWGGLRKAGPFHSQNTEPWFYRTPGLKIVAPSTPHDARALLAACVADPDPVLYYEHIALYRDPQDQASAATTRLQRPDPAGTRGAAPCRLGPGHRLVRRLRPSFVWRVAEKSFRRRHRGRGARSAQPGSAGSRIPAAPGNGGMQGRADCVEIDAGDVDALVEHVTQERYDLVVVGPEAPLVAGLADRLGQAGVAVFGPSAAAAQIEGSKIFSKELMARHSIPTASFAVFNDCAEAERYIASGECPMPCVVKADGLAAGKGVLMCDNAAQTVDAVRSMLVETKFGTAGDRIIIEETLQGREASFFVLTDGKAIVELATCQDYKRAFDGDQGLNTGGMGTYSPSAYLDDAMRKTLMESIVKPTIAGMAAEGTPYRGVLYTGVMLTKDGPKVLEYNARFGDPETQVLMPRLDGDWLALLHAAPVRAE